MRARRILPPLVVIALGSMLVAPVPDHATDELAPATSPLARGTPRALVDRVFEGLAVMGKDLD